MLNFMLKARDGSQTVGNKSERNIPGRERANGTMARSAKGPIVPPPRLSHPLDEITRTVSSWPDVTATGHWDPFPPFAIDGVDFYFRKEELGHIHANGSIHLATSPNVGRALVREGLAQPFRMVDGWVCENVRGVGLEATIALFRTNYDWISNTGLASRRETTPRDK